ncbi:transforming growth factor-beta receptor-associated protein 1-like [Asterias rubens]|uniref:transforming growth factor-beta receptor-associated protein 1-like n=1 Tax=Asterias rubens TaxID=7604 RepID=UPI0014551EC6|nr:transforming growth factor-beta receptor-associated protein 1-like [Asterias rubens]
MSVKAFELVPAIERLKLLGEKARTAIECIECCGKNLYIGTSDCFVIHFLVEEKTLPNGKITYTSEKQSHKYLAVKKPIQQLKAASALTRILVLCDNVLTLLNMFNLEPILSGAKIKGVTAFCVNNNPRSSNPFSLEIAVTSKRKQVQVYTVTEDKCVLIKEISISDIPVNLSMDAFCICIATSNEYILANYHTGVITDLFPYDADQTSPVVKRVGKEEFLLAGPSSLGMFVTSAGISQRPPLKWSETIRGVSYLFPYVVAMDDEFLTVHSVLDQQQKQTIPFQGGRILGDFEGRIFVSSSKEVYALVPLPVEKQIQALLSDKRVEEALTLAKNAKKLGLAKDKFQKLYQRIQQQSGFIELSEFHFDEAGQLFKDGLLDVRELISLFPNLLPSTSNFNRSVPLLHQFADISSIVRGSKEKLQDCKTFLSSYLDSIRGGDLSLGFREEIDTALLKLYAESSPELLKTLVSSENTCSLHDAAEILQKHGRHHALGLLYRYHIDNEKALLVWARICDGELKDDTFPGLDFVVEFLSRCSDHELVWRYVDWALQKNPELGVKIFTDRSESEPLTERMRPDTVIDYLHAFPKAVMRYLEHLVFTKKLEKEKYHTHLAVLYLDDVLKKNPETSKPELDLSRSKLRHMLQESSLYRVQLILGKVRETDMFAETAILYGKLEEHDKALRILVHKLQDYGAAERYCCINSRGRDRAYRRRLFQILLGVYLDPLEGKKDSLIAPAIALLNSEDADFDASRVLQLIPENWSTALLSQFLTNTVRKSLHTSRTTKLQRMLTRTENLNLKVSQISQQRDPIYVGDDRNCQVCNRPFHEPTFARYPNGVIVHTQCAWNKTVCPVTGRLFSTKISSSKS